MSGAFATASLVQAQAEFVRATPGELRGRAIGVAAAGLIGVQGLAVLLGGVVAQVWGARAAVALCGALGIAVALVVTDAHVRSRGIGDGPTCRAAVARAEG